MKILVMGGTGAIGQELVPLLSKNRDNQIIVTSRKKLESQGNVQYIQADAKSKGFVQDFIKANEFDVIADFMLYSKEEFKSRYQSLLNACKQYLFFSSSRVYAQSQEPINELSDRLLDVCQDKTFLCSGEYSLTKAQQEDILRSSNQKNWVIIRPYKTYGNSQLQLGVLEMEQWLYRAVTNKTVVIPGCIGNLHTSLTDSRDTARILLRIAGDETLNGEIFQIANPERITWHQIVQVYSECIEKNLGHQLKVRYVKDTSDLELLFNNRYRIQYDGLVNRIFDDSKIISLMGKDFCWTSVQQGLSQSMELALIHNASKSCSNFSVEGLYDKYTGEFSDITKIPGNKNRLQYLMHRLLSEKIIHQAKSLIFY